MEFVKYFYPWAVFLICFFDYAIAEFSNTDCTSLGFNKATLVCSICDQLGDFNLELLKEHCQRCCNQDEGGPEKVKKYSKARLEVCTCKFGAYPQIQAFIKSDKPGKYPNLAIRYVRGLDPIIKLMDADGNVQETLAIDKWNTDSIDEFLKTYLDHADDVLNLDYLTNNLI